MPSPYGPPEPIRPPEYAKIKRESVLDEAGSSDDAKPRNTRKVEIKHFNNKPVKKKVEQSEDLIAAPSKVEIKDDKVATTFVKVAKNKKEEVKKVVKKIIARDEPVEVVEDEEDDFYETKHEPQAEPLSLRQNFAPRTKIKKKKPGLDESSQASVDLIKNNKNSASQSKSIIKRQDDVVFVPLIYEAVPSSPDQSEPGASAVEEIIILDEVPVANNPEEVIFDNVFQEVVENNDQIVEEAGIHWVDPEIDVVEFLGSDTAELILSQPAAANQSPAPSQPANQNSVFSHVTSQWTNHSPASGYDIVTDQQQGGEKNHQKRKIDIKDYYSKTVDPYFYLLKQDFPTIYRSQTSQSGNVARQR